MTEGFKECLRHLKADRSKRRQLIEKYSDGDFEKLLHQVSIGLSVDPGMGSAPSKAGPRKEGDTDVGVNGVQNIQSGKEKKRVVSVDLNSNSPFERTKSAIELEALETAPASPESLSDLEAAVGLGTNSEDVDDSPKLPNVLDLIERCVTNCLKENSPHHRHLKMSSPSVSPQCSLSIESTTSGREKEPVEGGVNSGSNIFVSLFDKFGCYEDVKNIRTVDDSDGTDSDDDDRPLPLGSCVVYDLENEIFKAQLPDGRFFDVPDFAQPQTEEERAKWESNFCGTFRETIMHYAEIVPPKLDVENIPVSLVSEVINEDAPDNTHEETTSSQTVDSNDVLPFRRSQRNRNRLDSDFSETSSEAPSDDEGSWASSRHLNRKPRRNTRGSKAVKSSKASKRLQKPSKKHPLSIST